jgi:hypothetical protein
MRRKRPPEKARPAREDDALSFHTIREFLSCQKLHYAPFQVKSFLRRILRHGHIRGAGRQDRGSIVHRHDYAQATQKVVAPVSADPDPFFTRRGCSLT